jgi:predicted O-linked N-acetylglucosamine transferase (SPINDLY family)
VEIAVELGGDLSRLEKLRASLRDRFEQSPLRDEKRFAANFEVLLRTAWQQRGPEMPGLAAGSPWHRAD